MLDYRIVRTRGGQGSRLFVCKPAIEADDHDSIDTLDVVNEFPDTPRGLDAARAYVIDTTRRNAALMRDA